MDDIDNQPDGIAARLRALEDEDDDGVDYSIPATWGVNKASKIFLSESETHQSASSTSRGFTTSSLNTGFTRCFAISKKRLDPFESPDQQRSFSFSSAVRAEPRTSDWDSYDPATPHQSEKSRKSQRHEGQTTAIENRANIHDRSNRALEGTFGSTDVKRITEENSEFLDITLPDVDPRLENPDLDIDPNVRANFLPISQLHRAPTQLSPFAIRNPTLVASNTGGSIISVLGGERIIHTAKPVDSRVSRLDRHGKYIHKYEGEIRKSALRQHMGRIRERDRQMQQATAEYRVLVAMSAEDRTELLERLRKPYEWHGAHEEDQHDELETPVASVTEIPTDRVLRWMEEDFSRVTISTQGTVTPSTSGSTSRRGGDSANSYGPSGDFGDLDEFTAASPFNPLAPIAPREEQYFDNVLRYTQKRTSKRPVRPVAAQSSSSVSSSAQIGSRLGRTQLSDIRTDSSTTPSSRGFYNPLVFDDSPEFQIPGDYSLKFEVQFSSQNEILYQRATTFSQEHGRVVQVQLHELVKFTPGAIARRVFGGIIQEMQLFPVQRIAIVIFLHPSEANAFVRHVKKVREQGSQVDITELQIEAGWYKGSEKSSLLPAQPNILQHVIGANATRCLRLSHLHPGKKREELSYELGFRLAMPFIAFTVIVPASHLGRAALLEEDARTRLRDQTRIGRQAVVQFASIIDAIRARRLLMDGDIAGYESCEPVFVPDPSSALKTERGYCACRGCKELRSAKVSRSVAQ